MPSLLGGQPEHAPMVEVQPVGTPERRAAALARVSALAGRVDDDIENLRQGVRSGHVATRENVERIAAELDPAARDPARELAPRPARAPRRRPGVPGAARRRNRARPRPGGGSLPGLPQDRVPRAGAAEAEPPRAPGRRGLLPGRSSPPRDAGARARCTARDRARAGAQAVQAEIEVNGGRAFGTSNVQVLLQRLHEDPAFRSRDARELVATSRAAVNRAAAAAPRWFGKTLRAPVDVRELPEMLRGSGPVGRRGSDVSSGKLVGLYLLTAPGETGQERVVVEAAAFHATIPGHHLQLATALEGGGAPDAGRYLPNGGFAEGWALYAERLAGEMGLYSDDLSRLGALAREALCAAGLVADSGLTRSRGRASVR